MRLETLQTIYYGVGTMGWLLIIAVLVALATIDDEELE